MVDARQHQAAARLGPVADELERPSPEAQRPALEQHRRELLRDARLGRRLARAAEFRREGPPGPVGPLLAVGLELLHDPRQLRRLALEERAEARVLDVREGVLVRVRLRVRLRGPRRRRRGRLVLLRPVEGRARLRRRERVLALRLRVQGDDLEGRQLRARSARLRRRELVRGRRSLSLRLRVDGHELEGRQLRLGRRAVGALRRELVLRLRVDVVEAELDLIRGHARRGRGEVRGRRRLGHEGRRLLFRRSRVPPFEELDLGVKREAVRLGEAPVVALPAALSTEVTYIGMGFTCNMQRLLHRAPHARRRVRASFMAVALPVRQRDHH